MDGTYQPQVFPMRELEQIEQALSAAQQWTEALTRRRDLLTEELERVTRPASVGAAQPVQAVQKAVVAITKGYAWKGQHVRCWHDIEVHMGALETLWKELPDQREAMAAAVSQLGSARNYVARSPQELHPTRTLVWAQRYSRRLADGWYADTNLNRERMSRILHAAVRAAGLVWGEDVRVCWRTQARP